MLSPAGSFRDMKTREQIITSMCYTYRHDYGLERSNDPGMISSGMTEQERQWLWAVMAQIFDNDIAPHMEFRHG
jgi:hypothetical protein